MGGAAAEQGWRGADDPDDKQRGEREQTDSRGGDLGQRAEPDHGTREPEVGGEVEAGERFGAMLRGGDLGDGLDRALEHETAANPGNDIAGYEDAEAGSR